MKTIGHVLTEFLDEQRARLKPGTYRMYEHSIGFFEAYLDGYAYEYLDDDETTLFDRVYDEEGKEFCEVFSPNKISSTEIHQFLGYFMIRKVIASRELMRTVGRVMGRLVKWLHEKGYMDRREYKESAQVVDMIKGDLPDADELPGLIFDYMEDNPHGGTGEILDSYFGVVQIEPGRLWLRDTVGPDEKVGPVFVSKEISSKCKVGWTINLKLGKAINGWEIMDVGLVYPG